MVDKTLTALISETQKLLYQQAGLGVQVYSQDNIAQKIVHGFDLLFTNDDYKWKRFDVYVQKTLDGTTGRVTTDIDEITSFDDLYSVYRGNTDHRLTKFSSERNPFNVTGTTPMQYMADGTRLIRVVPFTSTGDVVLYGRQRPATYPFILTDVVPFDYIALTYFAAWSYCADDAANAAQADKFQGLFEERIKQLHKSQNNEPIALNADRVDIPTRWHDG
jgi:hypothetical protein